MKEGNGAFKIYKADWSAIMTLDERIAEIKASSNSQPETEVKEDTQVAPGDSKTEEVGNTGNDGEAGDDKKPTDAPESTEESLPKEDDRESEKAKPEHKFSKKEKARHAFAELTSKNSKLKEKLDKVMKYLEECKGVKYDPSTTSLEDYLAFDRNKNLIEQQKSQIESELNAEPEELRLLQADAIWDNEADLNDYKTNVIPHLAEINKVLAEKAPMVLKFLKYSEKAPILEKAFMSNDGAKMLAFVNTDSELETRDRCKALIAKLTTPKEVKKEEKPIAPKPSRATGSVTSAAQKASGASIQAPSLDQMRKMMRG